jgi:capsular polysaccharide biosynthesis protein
MDLRRSTGNWLLENADMSKTRSMALVLAKCGDRLAAHLPGAGDFRPLRGTFSALDELNEGKLRGEVVVDRQAIGPCPPDSITARCGMSQHDHQPWPVFWTRSDDARLVGNLLHWRNSADHICLEGCYHFPGRRRLGEDRLLAQLIVPPATHLKGAWTSIASNWGDGRNYFHWVTDNLTRLWLSERLPETTRVLIPHTTARYVRESLEMLGIQDLCEMRGEPCLQPERFYFCSPLAMTGVWNPLGFDWLRERFSQYFPPAGSGRPVFLTRRANTRVPEGLEQIESMFSAAGFEILDCGKLGFREQIEIASAAPAIAGIHGAAMTNILWSQPGTPVLEIFQPEYLNACYEQIAFQGRLDYSACVLEGEDPVREIERWLQR